MITAERGDVYCDIGDALSVTIFVHDGNRNIALIYPRVEYDERRNAGFSRMEQFQKAMLFIMSISTRKTTGLKTLP